MKKKTKTKIAAGAAAGLLATAAVAAAGYYFYGSKGAARNRRIAVKWANDMKRDVVRQAKKLKKVDRAAIARAVDQAMKAYGSMRGVERTDLQRAARELKDNWQLLAKEMRGRAMAGAMKAASGVRASSKKKARRGKKHR